MMRRLLLLLLLCGLAGLALAAPALIGVLVERQTRLELGRLASRQPALTLREGEFERGWLHSRSRHVLSVDLARILPTAAGIADLPVLELVLDSRYRHGPVTGGKGGFALARVDSRFTLGGRDGGHALPGEALTLMHLGGGGETLLRLAAVSVEYSERYGGLDWSGGQLAVKFDGRFSRVQLDGQLGALDLRDVEGSLAVGPVTLSADVHDRGDTWQAQARLAVERMDAWTRRSPRSRTLGRSLDLLAEATMEADRLSVATSTSMARLQLLGRESRNLEANLRVDGLAGSELRALQTLWREAVRNALPREQVLARLQGSGAALAASGFELTLERLSAELHYGPLDGHLLLKLPREEATRRSMDVAAMLRGMEADTAWRLPRGLVELGRSQEATRAQLELLLGLGVLQPSGEHYQVGLRYGGGLLNINGVELPIGALLPAAVAVPE